MQESNDIQPDLPTQPSPPERGRAWRIVAIVLTLHAALLGSVVLIQGCSKSDTSAKNDTNTSTVSTAPDASTPAPDSATTAQNGSSTLPNGDALTPEEHLAPSTPESSDPSFAAPTPLLNPATVTETKSDPSIEKPAPAAATPASAAKPAAAPAKYVVKKGDTLAKIAKHNSIALTDLASANKLQKNAALKIGQKLIVPGKKALVVAEKTPAAAKTAPTVASATSTSTASQKMHVVKSGESPTSIAKMYGVSVDNLMKANHISDPRKMRINQKLVIPVSKVAGTTTPAPRDEDLRPTAAQPATPGTEERKI